MDLDDEIPEVVLAELRAVCSRLPDAYEEPAWTGRRWRIRQRTFAHVLVVDEDRLERVNELLGRAEPTLLLTFRAPAADVEVLAQLGHPFFNLGWGRDAMGMVIDDGVNWEEVAELVTDSYCVMAPKKLAALVDRPPVDGEADGTGA